MPCHYWLIKHIFKELLFSLDEFDGTIFGELTFEKNYFKTFIFQEIIR
jgi:hypothetical protein